ncbi:Gfo/Idh/MocA family protein [Bythopirellula goksoeyrii]|uniref:Inositol 2-dehydrogenase n=1 Tax=Bythopirellula goksoeyrii TaxID=1400387 RepID=A0A5B9QGC2_9BACT|nr:Gfo/Idh/MocA family oxidoreductase [Bythopirellula goksoeyrii]QEG36720.1 Inositol 2-dehydrogenase [Bythopirellula goksoeyrii]
MSVSRRQFIASTATTAASLGLMGLSSARGAETADIRIGVIGLRGRGKSHLDGFGNNVVAICDVDEEVLNDSAAKFQEKHGRNVDTLGDYRRLLERKDIDAVSIATPNHTHALIAVAAAQAGKDVYCEKPIAHNIWESRQVVQAARKYDRIIQCGTQARSSRSIQGAVDYLRSGNLGKVRYAVGTCYKPRPSIGKLDQPLKIPSSIDYDLWCGPVEMKEIYRPHLHYDWHWDFNTGNGDMGNQGIHQMDVARWLMGANALAPRVLSIGGRLGYDDAGDTPNSQIAYYDYPEAPLIFETRGLPHSKAGQKNWGASMDKYRGMQIAAAVQCEDGFVVAGSSYNSAIAYDNDGNVVKKWNDRSESHFDNWLKAVANHDRSQLNAEIQEGHLSSSLCFMGSISHQLGSEKPTAEIAEMVAGRELLANSFDRMASHLRANDVDIDTKDAITLGATLELDPATELFVDNDAANALRSPKQRAPFIVPNLESVDTRTAAS